ncbi:hypothetical protein ARMSODRAFT_982025 [Armillaria solidipes]|uniref:Uncharacterized protein n=1 Tax=Armillaria solidipes TaxID=1076256 RepID=A0A2H3AVM6_9AGAR|nr:hypothetical protein ARMSODRAFT_982025 [Armillaria solidipes]
MTVIFSISTFHHHLDIDDDSCTKTSGVRSNAKWHLRSHGTFPQADKTNQTGQYTVNLLPPSVNSRTDSVHPAPCQVQPPSTTMKWVPSSLMSCTNALRLREAESSSLEYDGDDSDSSYRSMQLSLPLSPVVLSIVNDETDDSCTNEARTYRSTWKAVSKPLTSKRGPYFMLVKEADRAHSDPECGLTKTPVL